MSRFLRGSNSPMEISKCFFYTFESQKKYKFKPAPGQHILWDGWIPIKIERTRERPTASHEPYETIVIESVQINKADGRERMERLITRARDEAKADMEHNLTIQVYGKFFSQKIPIKLFRA